MALDLPRLARALGRRDRAAMRLPGFRESAVLVPIVIEAGLPDRLLFIERHAELRHHAGQIAFPGGTCDPGDGDASATALREACEELGIAPASVEVLGWLDDVPTPSRFVITPVVGRIDGPLELRPAPAEVAGSFLADLAALASPDHYSDGGEREFLNVRYRMHQYRWGEFQIWGATARIVHQLLALSEADPS